jgi:phage tail sheath gpL-like
MGASFPNITSNINSALTAKNAGERSILLVGCMISGTASSGQLKEGIISKKEFNDFFGAKSQIAKAGRAMIDALSVSKIKPKISAIGLTDNASGVASTGTIAFSGTATESGILTVYIDSIRNGKYELAVASGATATSIGGNLETLITANTYSPVSAVNTTGSVALTALNDGTQGNTIGIKIVGSVAGISTTLTAMASGATNPVLTSLFDPVADKRYTSIVYPDEWGTSTLTAFTEARFNVDNKIVDGVGIVCKNDTYANTNTAGDALNQKTLAYLGGNLISSSTHKGGAIFESPLVRAAYAAAYRELRLTEGANVSSITTNGQSIGGSFFGGIPYHNTPFNLLPIIETGHDFSDAECTELESSGIWLLRNNPSNTTIISNEAVTTYKTDALGQIDKTFKYVNYVDTLTIVRDYVFQNLKADFSQHILTTGQLIAGRPMVNREGFIARMMGYYGALSGYKTGNNNYVLLRAGSEEANAFKKALEDSIVITLVDGKISAESIANIVTQVRQLIVNFTPTFE